MRYGLFRQLYKKNATEVVPALLNASQTCSANNEISNEADKIKDCGNYIRTIKCSHCGTDHFKSFHRCKSKFCTLCQRVKSQLWTAHLYSWLKQWLEQGNYVVFLNLTIQDTQSLQNGINILEGAWRDMSGKQYRKAFLSKFPGGFRSLEVKTGANSGLWHPHLHALVIKERYSNDIEFLKYVWPKSVDKNGGYAVNSKILPFKRQPGEPDEQFNLRLIKAVKEVCKYITKFNWTEEKPERVAEMYWALKGKRQYAVWGALANVRHEVEQDLAVKSVDDVKDFVCQVCGCTTGRPNMLFREIWDGPNEPIIKDYKTTPPATVYTEAQVDALKQAITRPKFVPRMAKREYVQEHFDFVNTKNAVYTRQRS